MKGGRKGGREGRREGEKEKNHYWIVIKKDIYDVFEFVRTSVQMLLTVS